jgi:DNA-binding response OmpR family regulator
VRIVAPEVAALFDADPHDAVLVDARSDLVAARGLCRLVGTLRTPVPVVAVLTEAGLVTVSSEWAVEDFLLSRAGPAEIDARLRLLRARQGTDAQPDPAALVLGKLVIDAVTYTAHLKGRPLDLTYKEFELLKYLAQHPAQVFTRRRARPAAARQARPRARAADRHRAQCRLQVRPARGRTALKPNDVGAGD